MEWVCFLLWFHITPPWDEVWTELTTLFFSPPRNSPLSYPAVNRYSSSSLSSQASAEVSNITGQSESSDEVFNMQVLDQLFVCSCLSPFCLHRESFCSFCRKREQTCKQELRAEGQTLCTLVLLLGARALPGCSSQRAAPVFKEQMSKQMGEGLALSPPADCHSASPIGEFIFTLRRHG